MENIIVFRKNFPYNKARLYAKFIMKGELVIEKVCTYSAKDAERLRKEGYAITAIAYFVYGSGATYILEKGSELSKYLGSK